ncbi:MAG: hypothetical protein KDC66_17685 [Phaeodactylibacter sp.]|nr:hypothetical protein [Phaeodactylibacter sp.]MCB9275766.1 hypothetical protein [Lewinellaceae bacterium]
MSDQPGRPDLSIEALKKEVSQLMEDAAQKNRLLEDARERTIIYHLQANQRMLEYVEAISGLRKEVPALIDRLEGIQGFDEEKLDELSIMGEQLLGAPLFHPQYETMLSHLAAARQNGQPFEAQLRQEIGARLEGFAILPGETEIEAGKAILATLEKRGEAGKGRDIELATAGLLSLARLAVREGLADGLPLPEAIPFLQNLKDGLMENAGRRQNEQLELASSSLGRQALQEEPPHNLDELKSLQEMLAKLKEALEHSISLGAPSPLIDEVAEQMGSEEEESYRQALVDAFLEDMLDESEGLLFSEDYDTDDDFYLGEKEGDWDDEEWEPVEQPHFPAGSSVEVITSSTPFNGFPTINIKGWQGRVVEALTNGEIVVYLVVLDSLSLQALPEKFIQKACEEEYGNFSRYELEEADLKPASPRDTPEVALATNRRLFHRYFWGNIEEDQQAARLYDIMMRDAETEDIDNWVAYFRKEVDFPFDAQVEGLILRHIEPGTTVEVLGIEGVDEKEGFGLIASIRKGRAILSFPLMELMPVNDKDPKAQPLLDYRLWADLIL